jgi:hypothetical protein
MTIDTAGNIYLALQLWGSKNVYLLELAGGSHQVMQLAQLPVSDSGIDQPHNMAISPDGQQFFVGLKDGTVLMYKEPHKGCQPEQVAKLHARVCFLYPDNDM